MGPNPAAIVVFWLNYVPWSGMGEEGMKGRGQYVIKLHPFFFQLFQRTANKGQSWHRATVVIYCFLKTPTVSRNCLLFVASAANVLRNHPAVLS
jgi:hypothetical protein